MKTHSISNPELTLFLKPVEPTRNASYEVDLGGIFGQVLERANDFVPSEAGAIYLEDATGDNRAAQDRNDLLEERDEPDPERRRELVVVSSFGEHAGELLGARLPVGAGIAGRVHQAGEAYISGADGPLLAAWNRFGVPLEARSVISAPLHLGPDVVGVLELVNPRDDAALSDRGIELLQVFAQTISVSLANAMEAQRSKEMARRDDLTRLYNDRYLHHSLSVVLKEALLEQRDCGLIFFDLDYFKTVNDTHGHLAGSRVLTEIGELLRQVLPGPALPARYGGDEFVIILPEASPQETYWVAETIRKTIEKHIFMERPDEADPINFPALRLDGITASVGLATLLGDTLEAFDSADLHVLTVKNEMLRRADTRMYRAKENGRNRTIRDDLEDAGSAGAPGNQS